MEEEIAASLSSSDSDIEVEPVRSNLQKDHELKCTDVQPIASTSKNEVISLYLYSVDYIQDEIFDSKSIF